MGVNPDYNISLDIESIILDLELGFQFIYHTADGLSLNLDIEYTLVKGDLISYSSSLDLELSYDLYIQYAKSNFVKWSRIGDFNFDVDFTNIAGETLMDWKGYVWEIGKLNGKLVVYGSGGITILTSAGEAFGKSELLPIGIYSSGAVLVTDSIHIFITSDGCLWKLTDTLENLGYSEYLNTLVDPVISHDSVNNLVFICDGSNGYVFNYKYKSFGKGPSNVTGICYFNGQLYNVASGDIIDIDTYLKTQPSDFNNRNFKIINEVEVGGDIKGYAEFGISYRNSNLEFSPIIWFPVTLEGRAFPHVFGKEFEFHLRTSYDIQLDYLNIKGRFADFNPVDV